MSPNFNLLSKSKNKKQEKNQTPEVIKLIGSGNNGKIELLKDLDEKQKQIVKKTTFDKKEQKIETEAIEELQAFRKELKKVKEENYTPQTEILLLGSSHIAKLCGTNGKESINLRHIEGSTINTLYRENEAKPTIEDTYSIVVQALAGLKFINEKLQHGDISSRNIMVDTKGKVKIIDFGMAANKPENKYEDFRAFTFVTKIMGDNYNKSQVLQYPNLTAFLEKISNRVFSSPDQVFEQFKSPELKQELIDMMKKNPNPYFQRILKNLFKD